MQFQDQYSLVIKILCHLKSDYADKYIHKGLVLSNTEQVWAFWGKFLPLKWIVPIVTYSNEHHIPPTQGDTQLNPT